MKRTILGSAAALSLAGAPALADINSGLRAYFPFDGNANDYSGFNRHGVIHGGVTFVPGRIGQAASFNGTNGWVGVSHTGALTFDLDTQSYTVSMFFRCQSIPTNRDMCLIQDRHGSNHSVSYNLCFNGNVVPQQLSTNSWYGFPTGTGFDISVPAAPLIGDWHHVTVTFDHATGWKRMYIDGVKVDEVERPNEPFTPGPGTIVTIGGYWSSNNIVENFFDGEIDEVRIYDRPLSQTEIQHLAGLTCSGSTSSLVDGFESAPDGTLPSGWQIRFPGDSQQITSTLASSGARSFRQQAGAFSAAEVQSTRTFPISNGQAVLSFDLLWSSESTATGPDCNDIIVAYQGASATFSMGFVRTFDDGSNAPLKIIGTDTPVQQDRWYRFMGIARFDTRTVDWYVDGQLVHACRPMGPGMIDASRRDRLALHVGCIDSGQSVAYFDGISFVPPYPTCEADVDGSGVIDLADLLYFLGPWQSGLGSNCP